MRALGALLLLAVIPYATAVKLEDFKTCEQAAFCRRGRALRDRAGENPDWRSPYSVIPSSLAISSNQASLTASVKSSLYPEIKFGLDVHVHKDGVVRVRMDEVDGKGKRYDETAPWALMAPPEISQDIRWVVGKSNVKATIGPKTDRSEVSVSFDPLVVTLSRNGREEVVLNSLGLLHMEHFRTKEEPEPTPEVTEEGLESEDTQMVMEVPEVVNPRAWFEGDTEDGYWEETWKSWTDSKPKGAL
jgi:mannosyl-oligosaccharide alpha-1,3-glucosidase